MNRERFSCSLEKVKKIPRQYDNGEKRSDERMDFLDGAYDLRESLKKEEMRQYLC